MKITWTKDLSVEVEAIDQQHRHFIDIVNSLYDAVQEKTTESKIEGILANLAEYADYHFETEEKYFKMFNFSGSNDHILEHDKIRKRIKNLIADQATGKKTVVIETIYFLEDWLKDHLGKMDRKYIECFHDNGLV